MEMDSTTVILPKHTGKVDAYGNILIYPDIQAPKQAGAAMAASKVSGGDEAAQAVQPVRRTIPETSTCLPRSFSATRSR